MAQLNARPNLEVEIGSGDASAGARLPPGGQSMSAPAPDRRSWKGALLALCTASLTGCAVSLSAAPSAGVDTTGHVAGEGRLSLSAAAGSPHYRMTVGLGAGAGYLDRFGSGYATVGPEVGVEGGRKVVWSGALFYAPKFLFKGPFDVAQGVGLAGQVLFRVANTGGEKAGLLIGPRLTTEAVIVDSEPGGQDTAALFQLALVLRWVMFDTTGSSWTR